MKIDANELRREINKLYSEMGWISKTDVKNVIDKLERKPCKKEEK